MTPGAHSQRKSLLAEVDLAEVERVAVELGTEVEALWHDTMARSMIDAQKLNNSRGINS